jgi:hypothetical protein
MPTTVAAAEPEREAGLKLNKDTLMGAILIAAGIVTYLYMKKPSVTRRMLTLIGAAATVIIGALLFFQIA